MATIGQARGALLEELMLYFLNKCGYKTVEKIGNDPTLSGTSAGNGISVKGRGEKHQIDSIADFKHTPPFSYPIRLLLEAKFVKGKVGIGVVRNAVGVLKDVSEFFTFNDLGTILNSTGQVEISGLQVKRYHYQYAICSADGFSKNAQKYAFAQDIYLLDLDVGWIGHFVSRIKSLKATDLNSSGTDKNINIDLKTLRKRFREFLEHGERAEGQEEDGKIPLEYPVDIKKGLYFGVLNNVLPVPLVSMVDNIEEIFLEASQKAIEVRIFFELISDDRNDSVNSRIEWSIKYNRREILKFQLPYNYFYYFFKQKLVTKIDAINTKSKYMSEIDIPFEANGNFRIAKLRLDQEWINDLLNNTIE